MVRKTLFLLLVLSLLVVLTSGCNLPRRTALTSTPDLVATQVATILAAYPTADLQTTPTPSAATPTPAVATSSPSPSATATISSDDPRSSLGEPTYSDPFDNAERWGLQEPYDDGHTRIEVKNNQLVLTSLNAEGWLGWRTSSAKPGNAYIEATFSSGECSGGDQYGLMVRSTEEKGADFFAVTCDGRYSLTHYDGNQFSGVLDLKESGAIHTGANQTNRLGVWLEGSKIRLYANGSLLTETNDDQMASQGSIGAFISGILTANFTVNLSEMAYWDLQ